MFRAGVNRNFCVKALTDPRALDAHHTVPVLRVAFEGSVRHQPCRRALDSDLLRRFAKGKRFRLGKHICQEKVVMTTERVKGLNKSDKVAGNELCTLMNQLVEGMLTIDTLLSPSRMVRFDREPIYPRA